MGFVGYSSVVQPFGKEAFALKENSFCQKPFETTLGWHALFVKEKRVTPLQKAKNRIEAILRRQKYKKWFETL
jgi:parvulin-like peptidyl-prolyl isomerase